MKNNSLLLVFCILCATSVFSQIGLSLYPLNNTIGLKTSNLKSLSFELRMSYDVSKSTADLLYILQPEANFIYRIRKEERINFYAGLGGGYGVNNANGNFASASLLLGTELYPIASMQNLTITVEADPTTKFFTGYQTFKLNGLVGVAYYFSKNKK